MALKIFVFELDYPIMILHNLTNCHQNKMIRSWVIVSTDKVTHTHTLRQTDRQKWSQYPIKKTLWLQSPYSSMEQSPTPCPRFRCPAYVFIMYSTISFSDPVQKKKDDLVNKILKTVKKKLSSLAYIMSQTENYIYIKIPDSKANLATIFQVAMIFL